MDSKAWKYIVCAVAIAVLGGAGGVVAVSLIASKTYQFKYEHHDNRERELKVTGSARKRIHSDVALWHFQLTSDAKTLADAYKILKDADAKARAFLEKHGFKADEIAAHAVETKTNYRVEFKGWSGTEQHETRDAESYTLTRGYTITTPRVESVAVPSGAVTELIEQGVKVVSCAPEYYYSKIADLKVEMIGEASRDARARADQVVNNAGCAVVEVRHARMGVLQITQPNSTAVSDSGIFDTSTIEKDVTAVVALTLGIK
ncbi:MAG TPA: SIMPL domain-containing protein [Planctomycetota bacterium]|nr:SIMPL domain-containing protein [Planctomycetota bacterium]